MGRGLIYKRKHMQRPPFPQKIKSGAYPVLATVSSRYSKLTGRLSTCYSPVRHFTHHRSDFRVRLACVRHAASVQSEPESNSPVELSSFPRLNEALLKVSFPDSLFTCQRTRTGIPAHAPFGAAKRDTILAPLHCQPFFFASRFFFSASGSTLPKLEANLNHTPLQNHSQPLFKQNAAIAAPPPPQTPVLGAEAEYGLDGGKCQASGKNIFFCSKECGNLVAGHPRRVCSGARLRG